MTREEKAQGFLKEIREANQDQIVVGQQVGRFIIDRPEFDKNLRAGVDPIAGPYLVGTYQETEVYINPALKMNDAEIYDINGNVIEELTFNLSF